MNTPPPLPSSPRTLLSALLVGALLTVLWLPLSGRAQGPDDLPGELPPPPPPPATATDLTQMPLDVTPPPLDPRAQQLLQQGLPSPPAASIPPAPPATPSPAPVATPGRNGRRPNNTAAATPSISAGTAAAATPGPTPAVPGASIRLNFQNASLTDVLNYLSAAAGFIITQETPVTGTVNVVSQQPVSIDEAVDLLSSILADKGYAVVRNGRILKIVSLQDAPKRGDVPVFNTSDPDKIPRKDNLVTQILPVRYAEVGKLVDNLRPLLSNNATISSNDASNAIILTDTQTNIHRMAEIIHALDTSISGISQIKVFTLRYSDAKGLADVITQLFSPTQQSGNQNLPPQMQAFLARMGGGGGRGGPGGGGNSSAPESEARQAAARVVAVADQTSNSVIVAAPDEVMSNVADVIAQLDTSSSDITETQIFRLLHADATEMATNLSALYADTGSSSTTGNNNNNNNNNRGGQQQNRPPANNQNANSSLSARALLQTRVVVVADARTNSVLVSASHDTMSQVALTIGRLDADKSRKQHVFVYTLKHGDPDNVATILRGMYSTANTSTSSTLTQPSLSALPNRTQNGASSDITNALTNSNSSTGSR